MKPRDILVVGGGLVGSLWALMLARRGHRVHVAERRADMRKMSMSAGKSINLALSDRGLRALDLAGAGDVVRKEAIPMRGRLIHDEAGNTNLQPYGEAGQFINSVSRGGLNCTLMDLAEAHERVRFSFEQRCDTVTFGSAPRDTGGDGGERPTATFTDAAGRQATTAYDVIFGCDGAFSAVRMAMLFTDRFDYRIDWLKHGYKELTIPAGAGEGDRRFLIEKNALHIWPRGSFMLIALPNPDGSFTCTLFLPFEGPPGTPSFAALDAPAKVRSFFEATFHDAVPLMPTLLEDFAQNPTGALGTVRCAPWQRNGKVCLLGDAAHAIVPFYGQGMNAGFEDCTVLAGLLDETGDDFAEALARFSAERKADAEAIADLALYNFVEMRDRVADPRFVLQKKIERKISELYGDRYTPLYSMVTFSDLPYREAKAWGDAQEALLEDILAIEGVEERWASPAFENELRRRVDAFLEARGR